MRIRWSREASDDVGRLYAFRKSFDPQAAARLVQRLLDAPIKLIDHPRLGERLHRYADREVRHLRIDDCDMWYEVEGEVIGIVRVWHSREDR